jgi:hypothetical protein
LWALILFVPVTSKGATLFKEEYGPPSAQGRTACLGHLKQKIVDPGANMGACFFDRKRDFWVVSLV